MKISGTTRDEIEKFLTQFGYDDELHIEDWLLGGTSSKLETDCWIEINTIIETYPKEE